MPFLLGHKVLLRHFLVTFKHSDCFVDAFADFSGNGKDSQIKGALHLSRLPKKL